MVWTPVALNFEQMLIRAARWRWRGQKDRMQEALRSRAKWKSWIWELREVKSAEKRNGKRWERGPVSELIVPQGHPLLSVNQCDAGWAPVCSHVVLVLSKRCGSLSAPLRSIVRWRPAGIRDVRCVWHPIPTLVCVCVCVDAGGVYDCFLKLKSPWGPSCIMDIWLQVWLRGWRPQIHAGGRGEGYKHTRVGPWRAATAGPIPATRWAAEWLEGRSGGTFLSESA